MTDTKTRAKTARNEPLFAFPEPAEEKYVPLERGMAYIFRQAHHSEREIGRDDLHNTAFLLGRIDDVETAQDGNLAFLGADEEVEPILKRLDFCKTALAPVALSALDLPDGKVGLVARFVDYRDVIGYVFKFGFGVHHVLPEATDEQ